MFDFRKVLLATVAGLGLVATASAQVPACTLSVNNEGYVAVEGTTEELPQVQLSCTNATAFTGPLVLTLTASVPFTNQAQGATNANLDVALADTGADVFTSANSSVTQPGPSVMTITLNAVTAAATNNFWFTGLRINPSTLNPGATVTLSATATSVQITNTTAINAALVSKTLGTITINPAPVANTSICLITAASNPTLFPVSNILVNGGYLNSLKATADNTNLPGSTFYFVAPAPQTDGVAVTAKQGTRLAVTFSNLDVAGVAYYVPPTITGTNVTLTAYAAATGSTAA